MSKILKKTPFDEENSVLISQLGANLAAHLGHLKYVPIGTDPAAAHYSTATNLIADQTVREIDFSAHVSAGAVAVHLGIYNSAAGAAFDIWLRSKDKTNWTVGLWNKTQVANQTITVTGNLEIDSNYKAVYYIDNNTTVSIVVLGWWVPVE